MGWTGSTRIFGEKRVQQAQPKSLQKANVWGILGATDLIVGIGFYGFRVWGLPDHAAIGVYLIMLRVWGLPDHAAIGANSGLTSSILPVPCVAGIYRVSCCMWDAGMYTLWDAAMYVLWMQPCIYCGCSHVYMWMQPCIHVDAAMYVLCSTTIVHIQSRL